MTRPKDPGKDDGGFLEVDPAVPVADATDPNGFERVGLARAFAGAGIAVAGVALAIGALLLLGKGEPKNSATVAPPPTATGAPTGTPESRATPAAAPVVPVSVLNNSKVKGLATRAGTRFRAGGWPVSLTGNYRGLVPVTTVYYPAGQEASAQRFATRFGIPRVLPRSALPGLPTSGMTVLLTRDFRA